MNPDGQLVLFYERCKAFSSPTQQHTFCLTYFHCVAVTWFDNCDESVRISNRYVVLSGVANDVINAKMMCFGVSARRSCWADGLSGAQEGFMVCLFCGTRTQCYANIYLLLTYYYLSAIKRYYLSGNIQKHMSFN